VVWEIIERSKARGVPFEAVAMENLDGRNGHMRKCLNKAEIEYYGDIPANTVMYPEKTQIVYPVIKQGKRSKRYRIVAKRRYTARQLLKHPLLEWAEITLPPQRTGATACPFWSLSGMVSPPRRMSPKMAAHSSGPKTNHLSAQ
jgi:hypothetical protein